jgi:hypothetical protein
VSNFCRSAVSWSSVIGTKSADSAIATSSSSMDCTNASTSGFANDSFLT